MTFLGIAIVASSIGDTFIHRNLTGERVDLARQASLTTDLVQQGNTAVLEQRRQVIKCYLDVISRP